MTDSFFKFAIFNDTHIGYQETNSINGSDSFDAFQEALEISKFEKVDAVLHAGDLFHCKSPSITSHSRALEIMWNQCAGEPERDHITVPYFKGLSLLPNTASENINISLPFFVIHGNHDSPSGKDFCTPCELFSKSRIINNFKPAASFSSLVLYPVVIRRNRLDVIIYGLGNITQTAFLDCLGDNPIDFRKPEIELNEKTFTIFMVHQDAIARSRNMDNLQERILEKYPFFDLIIWGHEHEHIKFDMSKTKVVQMGSTIVTKYSKKYATSHYIMIFEVFLAANSNIGKNHEREEIQCQYHELPLQKSRPLLYKSLQLKNEFGREKDYFLSKIRETIKEMISGSDWEKPFIRVCIQKSPDLYDPHNLNLHQIEYEFEEQVANPRTIIKIKPVQRKNIVENKKGNRNNGVGEQTTAIDHVNFDEMIAEHVSTVNFDFLTPDVFRQSMSAFTGNDKKDAFNVNISSLIQNKVTFLTEKVTQLFPENHQMSDLEWDDFYSKVRPELNGIDQYKTNEDDAKIANNSTNIQKDSNNFNNEFAIEDDLSSYKVNKTRTKTIITVNHDEDRGSASNDESDPVVCIGSNQTDDLFNECRVKTKRKILKVTPKKRVNKPKMNTLMLSLVQA